MGDQFVNRYDETNLPSAGGMVGIRGEYQGIVIPIGNEISLGRDPQTAQLVFNNRKISRQHCTITYEESEEVYYVSDYSRNGVMRENGARIPIGEKSCFNRGDTIYIGNVDTVFRFI